MDDRWVDKKLKGNSVLPEEEGLVVLSNG